MALSRAEAKIIPFPETPFDRSQKRKEIEHRRLEKIREKILSVHAQDGEPRGLILFKISDNPTVGEIIPGLDAVYGKLKIEQDDVVLYSSNQSLGCFKRVGSSEDLSEIRWANIDLSDKAHEPFIGMVCTPYTRHAVSSRAF